MASAAVARIADCRLQICFSCIVIPDQPACLAFEGEQRRFLHYSCALTGSASTRHSRVLTWTSPIAISKSRFLVAALLGMTKVKKGRRMSGVLAIETRQSEICNPPTAIGLN